MLYDFTCMWTLKNKINEKVEQKEIHWYREPLDGCQMGGGWVRKVKGLKSTNRELQNSQGDVKHSAWNTVNNIVIMHGAGGYWLYHGDCFASCINV